MDREYLYERNFYILFQDSAEYLLYSDKALDDEDWDKMERYARASIINSTFLLECAANCCNDVLEITNSFKKDIDKLPALSKFEYYLSIKFNNKKFDRGSREIQNAADLKTIRDLIVHPKVMRTKWERIDDFRRQADFGSTQILKVPKTIEEFHRNDALICLRALCSFLDHFFRILCGYDAEITKKILISSDKFDDDPAVSMGTPDHWKVYQEKYLLRLKFIGLESKTEKTI